MNCKKPFVKGLQAYPCGQCLPCRINRRRLWAHRILLESLCHEWSAFVTLTYSDEDLPDDRSVSVVAVQNFLKRLRKAAYPRRIRFFACGEYGDISWRPHYHLALFGVHPGESELVAECWPFGMVDLGEVNNDSAQYIAGYVTKKLTSLKDDDVAIKLGGLTPEFARMSLRPGLGALALSGLSEWLTTELGSRWIVENGDVPYVLQHGKRRAPLGRYLRQKLRESIGMEAPGNESPYIREKAVQLSALFEGRRGLGRVAKGEILAEMNRGSIRKIEKRFEIYQSRRKI